MVLSSSGGTRSMVYIYILLIALCTWRVGKNNSASTRVLFAIIGCIVMCRLILITDLFSRFPGLTIWWVRINFQKFELVDALLTLGFPSPAFHKNLECSLNKLVGSFFNRHTIIPRSCDRKTLALCRHMVSVAISLPSSGCFSPFPHGTGSLSITKSI